MNHPGENELTNNINFINLMGVITFIIGKLIYPVLFTGGATIFAFRLGSELPIAARKAGRSLGMGYNYFKVTLRVY